MMNGNFAAMTDADRVSEGISRGVRRLGPEVQRQLQALVTPQALTVASAFFVAWLISHAIGIGFIVDAVLLGTGVAAIGLAVFAGIDELITFGKGAMRARTDAQMDSAAQHFANAVAILGVQTLTALLLRRAPQTFRGGRIAIPRPPANMGFLWKPGLRGVRNGRPGDGFTNAWGQIRISRAGTEADRRAAALHEAVHRALTPKLDILRTFRIQGRTASYVRSSLIVYLEEALAESFAQVSLHGLRGLITGIAFPVRNGYVSLLTRTAVNGKVVRPVLPEAAGLFLGSIDVKGWIWDVYFSMHAPD